MIVLTQNEIVDLLVEKLKAHMAGLSDEGYNSVDRKNYIKLVGYIVVAPGFSDAGPETVRFSVNDNTLGVEFWFGCSHGKFEGYWSRPIVPSDPGEWFGREGTQPEALFAVIRTVLLHGGDAAHAEPYVDTPCMGCGQPGCDGRCQE